MSLKSLLNILFQRWYVVALSVGATVLSAFILLKIIPPRFEGKATVVVDLGQLDPALGLAAQAATASNGKASLNSLIAVANSQRLAEEVFETLGYGTNPGLAAQYRQSKAFGRLSFKEWGANLLDQNLKADPSFDGSNVLVFKYRSPSSVEAATVANAFANGFVALTLDMRRGSAQQATQWLDPQIDKLRKSLLDAQDRLADYRKSANVLPASIGQDSDVSLLTAITTQLAQTKSDALKLETALAAKYVDSASLAQLAASPLLDSLKTQLINTTTDLARANAEVGPHNAKVIALSASRAALQQQIDAETTQIKQRLIGRLANYQEQIAFLQKQLAAQTKIVIQQQAKIDQMNNLTRSVDVDQDQLNVALRTAATTKLQSQASYSDVSLLDAAVPPESPSFPKKLLIMAASPIGGLVLGIAFALLVEMLNRKVRNIDDLNYALGLREGGIPSAVYG